MRNYNPSDDMEDDDQETPISVQAAAPVAPPAQSSGPAPDFDLDALRQQQADAQSAKRNLAVMGGVGDALANRQSFGNFFLKQMNPHQDVSGAMKAQADAIPDPTERYKQTLEAYKAAMQGKQLKRDSDKADRMLDKNSEETAQAQAIGGAIYDSLEKGKVVTNPEALAKFKAALTSGTAQSIHDTIESSKMLQDLSKEAIASKHSDAQTAKLASMFGNRQELQDQRIHEAVLKNLSGNKELNQKLVQLQNLDNAYKTLFDNDITPESIHEFQQTVRNNLGMKGAGGVGERESTYLNSLGLKGSRVGELLTGIPANISKDDPIVQHFVKLAQTERNNAKTQYDRRLRAVTSGNDSLYARNPALRMDLERAISAHSGQFTDEDKGLAGAGQVPTPVASGGGIIPSANANGPETRSINGATYVKVPGGWKKQ